MLVFPLMANGYDVLAGVVNNLGLRHHRLGGRHTKRGWFGCTCGLAKTIRKLEQDAQITRNTQ